MNAVDTNVLIYARDPRDSVKQEKARALTSNLTDGALLSQVACEFIAASRKLTAVGYTASAGVGRVGAIARAVEANRAFRERLCARRTIDVQPQPFVLGRDDRRGVHGRRHHAPLHGRL